MQLLTEDEIFNILEATDEKSKVNIKKRKEAEQYIYKFFDIIDPTGTNTKMYKSKFGKMNDKQFQNYMDDFLNDPEKNFYLQSMAFENESHVKSIKAALDFLGVPAEEYLYYRNEGNKDKPLRTKHPISVGYVNIKRLRAKCSLRNLVNKIANGIRGVRLLSNLTV